MRRAAIIVEPVGLKALDNIRTCEIFLATMVRSANPLLKVETLVPFNRGIDKARNPTLYQRLIAAKYNHVECKFYFSF